MGDSPVRVLILWASDKSTNLGVQALAKGTQALIYSIFPRAHVEFASYGDFGEKDLMRPRALLASNLTGRSAIRRAVGGFDLIVDTGAGDSFTDIYGFRRLIEMSLLRRACLAENVPFVMGPQTIGPFETWCGRWIARRTLPGVAVLAARDPHSLQYAEATLDMAPELCADVAFLLEPPKAASGERDVIVNISGLLWTTNGHVDAAFYRAQSKALIGELVDAGRRVTILCHVLKSELADADEHAMRELETVFPNLEFVVPTSLENARSLIASAEVLVGSRMHACLNALSVGVPAVPWAYSRKFQPLLESIDWKIGFDLRDREPDLYLQTAALIAEGLPDPLVSADRAKSSFGALRERIAASVQGGEIANK